METAATFNADMTNAMSAHRYGAQVEIKSAEELSNARLFRTENGSGFAIKPDGDIVAVFQSTNETGSVGYSMIQAAVEAGGRKLDAFDTFLPGIYETAGFKPVARLRRSGCGQGPDGVGEQALARVCCVSRSAHACLPLPPQCLSCWCPAPEYMTVHISRERDTDSEVDLGDDKVGGMQIQNVQIKDSKYDSLRQPSFVPRY